MEETGELIEVDFKNRKRVETGRRAMDKLSQALAGFGLSAGEDNVIHSRKLHSRLHRSVVEQNREGHPDDSKVAQFKRNK